jgi:hypothetical protein
VKSPPRDQPRRVQTAAFRLAFERLDRALEKNAPWDNTEKIQMLRQACFADVDALERSGEVVLPKNNLGAK